MNNMSMLIGRLVSDPQINENENGRKVCNITLAVPRNFKNEEGIYETDFIPVVLWASIAETVKEYCRKGDLIAVKGRLQRFEANDYTCNGHAILEVVAEKVSFLSSKPNKEEE